MGGVFFLIQRQAIKVGCVFFLIQRQAITSGVCVLLNPEAGYNKWGVYPS